MLGRSLVRASARVRAQVVRATRARKRRTWVRPGASRARVGAFWSRDRLDRPSLVLGLD